MENVNSQFFLSLLIIGLGYIFKRLNIIKQDDGDGVSRIIFNITLPSLIIYNFNTMKLDISLIFITLTSCIFGIFMGFLGILIFRNESRKIRGTLSMLIPGFNIGLFAYPLVEGIWGKNGVKYFGMFDMGNTIPIFVVCYLIASYFSSDEKNLDIKITIRKLLTSIPLMTYIITLILNLSGHHYPGVLINVTAILSKANAPLSLLLLGICLNFTIDKVYRKNIFKILLIRYSIGLAVGIILFNILPFNELYRYTLLIGLIMPIGMADIPYAVEFNYDKKFIGTICDVTIIISFILMWIILGFF
ncbi:AEC family transporter [Clostridium tyrobutyricum]|uniref:AEC family transporter n=1 Tax=Clostridium tyrobutyricum TaxID=1519 RepID=UPI0005809F72|nr:AEC family transporter [Clostridium tyrobutyricum]